MSIHPDTPRVLRGVCPGFSDDEWRIIVLALLERRMDLHPGHDEHPPLGIIIDRIAAYLGLDDDDD